MDILLAESLCRQYSTYEQYLMHADIRAWLLQQARAKPDFRLADAARVLLHYIHDLQRNRPYKSWRDLQAQARSAMVYIDDDHRRSVMEQIKEELRRAGASQAGGDLISEAELERLAHLIEQLAPELAQYPELVEYARYVRALVRNEKIEDERAYQPILGEDMPSPAELTGRKRVQQLPKEAVVDERAYQPILGEDMPSPAELTGRKRVQQLPKVAQSIRVLPLSINFQNYFRVVLAYTPALIEITQRIRYEVYSREFHFEREENCPGGLGKDEYDQFSIHCLVIHGPSNTPAGCVRLIKIPDDNPALLLPLERFCGHSLRHETLHPALMPRQTLCEISHLTVHTAFRRRPGESASPLGSNRVVFSEELTEKERRTFPLISVALIAASTALMVISDRPNLFIMVERWLATRLRQMGLDFIQVGEEIDYHGPRAAYFITVEQMLSGMKGDLRELYGFVYASLKANVDRNNLDLTA